MSVIPSSSEVRALLAPMTMVELGELAERCGVPYTTLVKVRNGQTENPRLDTVCAIWPFIAPERIGAVGTAEPARAHKAP